MKADHVLGQKDNLNKFQRYRYHIDHKYHIISIIFFKSTSNPIENGQYIRTSTLKKKKRKHI